MVAGTFQKELQTILERHRGGLILTLLAIAVLFYLKILGVPVSLAYWRDAGHVHLDRHDVIIRSKRDELFQDDYRLIGDLSLTKENAEDILFEPKFNARATGCPLADLHATTDLASIYKMNEGKVVCQQSGWPFQSNYLLEPKEEDSIKQRVQQLKDELSPREQPMNIVIILLESTSRVHFMLNFPETQKLMKDYFRSETSSHQLFTFNRLISQGPSTTHNMLPQLTGELWDAKRDSIRGDKTNTFEFFGTPLWERLKQFGYVTAVGSHDPTPWGMRRDAGHPLTTQPPDVFQDFAANKSDANLMQFCDHPHSKIQLMFVQRFMNQHLYAGAPKFIYVHLNDQPDTHFHYLQPLLDVPLTDTLQMLLKDSNTVAIVQGDHGLGIHNSPLYTMFVPRQFLQAHPDIQRNLWNNQIRPISALDIYATYLSFVRYPVQLDFSDPEVCYDCGSVGGTTLAGDHVFNRTCSSTRIPKPHCTCADEIMERIHIKDLEKALIEATALAQGICDEFNLKLEKHNLLTGQPTSDEQRTTCETLKVKSIIDLKKAVVIEMEEWTIIKFSVESSIDVHYEVLVRNGEVFSAKAMTKYSRFTNCTDRRFSAKWCICSDI